MSTNRHEHNPIDDKVRNFQKLQADVRAAFASKKKLDEQVKEDPANLDETELKEREEAKRKLPMAELEHEAATLRLRIFEEQDSKALHVQDWRDRLEAMEKQLKSGELLPETETQKPKA